MNKIDELSNAVQQLGVLVNAHKAAEKERENWRYSDLHRAEGSPAQDERHERLGREASERASEARQKVHAQKDLIAKLTDAI